MVAYEIPDAGGSNMYASIEEIVEAPLALICYLR